MNFLTDNKRLIDPAAKIAEQKKSYLQITDKQVETVCRELFGEHVSECLRLHVKQALKKAFENEQN